ncbi:PucR family transcriptional regulator [Liquorilactobacillus ghanensis DSM 18630]|uniref:PucR family transcriptional regulator n=1 Tax=Liquorilactobacillus ghanensis DSM 18630 TaxID=1423750 RepID=A0A0R1VT16_9LACO|nr:PucR family transcriptional regulator [Liquorilactobacillus ghanensis]KRM06025.1 PucR family transcriptional regulator [Liquorilactobacillus ghanensis DSM 18630]
MAIKLRTVYYATREKYEMKLLTGSSGLDHLFSWVHILENIDTMDYLHGSEIVITTGIGINSASWLNDYVKKVIAAGATALIINTGKFINEVPLDIIEYCRAKHFPLFTVPWRIHLIDIIRDYCNRIFLSEQISFNLMESIKNAIFHPERPELYQQQLERNDFNLNGSFALIAIRGHDFKIQQSELKFYGKLQLDIEIQLNAYGFINSMFEIEDAVFIVINNSTKLRQFANSLNQLLKKHFSNYDFEVSVSETVTSITKLHQAYKQVKYVMNHIQKNNSNSLCFFEKNGINELILAVNDFKILEKTAQRILSPLITYDRENQTDYVHLLQLYLRENCSIKSVAEKTFMHRNTINYRIKKIKAILPLDLDTNEERFRLTLAFYILDII